MVRSGSPRLAGYAVVATAGLVAALLAGRPDLAAFVAPLLVALAVALTWRPLAVEGGVALERDRTLEGERVDAIVTVENRGPAARVEVHLPASARLGQPGAEQSRFGAVPVALRLEAGERRELRLPLVPERWGVHLAGPTLVRARDDLGAFALEGYVGETAALRAYPSVTRLRELVPPLRTRPVLGSEVSRERGEGVEFADMRPLVPGDRVRSINWRATARRGEPVVNVQHPEQSADVVLFLDTFAEAEHDGVNTLDEAVRAAAGLASAYLARRDRVALVSFGGVVEWLTPSTGARQLYRIVDALLESHVRRSLWWTDVSRLPRGLLPSRAVVIGLTPLLDDRGITALLDLRARGFDLAVVEVAPLDEARTPTERLWQLQRDVLRARFEALGVPVARWHPPAAGLDLALEEVIAFRRRARPAPHA